MENQVILVQSASHAKEVIEYWKWRGVDTSNFNGSFVARYCGVINDKFGAFYRIDIESYKVEYLDWDTCKKEMEDALILGRCYDPHEIIIRLTENPITLMKPKPMEVKDPEDEKWFVRTVYGKIGNFWLGTDDVFDGDDPNSICLYAWKEAREIKETLNFTIEEVKKILAESHNTTSDKINVIYDL